MKKFFLISLLALLGMSQAAAQEYEYVPFVREGVKWICSYENSHNYIPTLPDGEHFFTLEFKGEAVIDGKTYKAMHKYSGEEIDPSNDTIPIYMREEDKVVYAIVPDGKTYEDCPIDCLSDSTIAEDIRAGREFVLFDFNDPEGFIMSRTPEVSYIVHRVKPQTIMLGDRRVTRYVFCNRISSFFCFIEGVGCDGLPLGYPLAFPIERQSSLFRMHLSHVIEDGKVIYRSERYKTREDELLHLVREGVQWVNERVVIEHGDTTRSYYTYEFKGMDEREHSLCHYYEGDSLDSERDSVIAKFFPNWINPTCDFNKALSAVYNKYHERRMMYWINGLYGFSPDTESLLDGYNPVMFYNIIQLGEDLTLDNFVEVEPVWIEGYKCRRYAYYGDGDKPLCYVVEGIGFDSRDMGDLLTPFTRQPDPDADYQEYWGLSHVIKDGQIIYKGMRYKEPAAVVGDVNGDGRLTIADVTALIDILLGSGGADSFNMPGDINMDNHLSIADVTALIDLLLIQQ